MKLRTRNLFCQDILTEYDFISDIGSGRFKIENVRGIETGGTLTRYITSNIIEFTEDAFLKYVDKTTNHRLFNSDYGDIKKIVSRKGAFSSPWIVEEGVIESDTFTVSVPLGSWERIKYQLFLDKSLTANVIKLPEFEEYALGKDFYNRSQMQAGITDNRNMIKIRCTVYICNDDYKQLVNFLETAFVYNSQFEISFESIDTEGWGEGEWGNKFWGGLNEFVFFPANLISYQDTSVEGGVNKIVEMVYEISESDFINIHNEVTA